MLLALGVLILLVFFAGIILSSIEAFASNYIPLSEWTVWTIEMCVTIILNAGVFALIYRYVPKREVPWEAALRGGLLAALIWEVGRQILSSFVIGQKYSTAYGVVGAFLAIMVWAYYAVSVIFFGAEYAQTVADRTSDSGDRSL
jgi:membrane protein